MQIIAKTLIQGHIGDISDMFAISSLEQRLFLCLQKTGVCKESGNQFGNTQLYGQTLKYKLFDHLSFGPPM